MERRRSLGRCLGMERGRALMGRCLGRGRGLGGRCLEREAEPMMAGACQVGSGKGAGLRERALEGGAWRGGVARDGRGLWVGGAWVGGGAGIRLGHLGGRDIKGGGA